MTAFILRSYQIVSQPIQQPDTGLYVYVIFVEESEETPHFLHKRKGCYVRTDEYSQRFEPRLANLDEIEFLQNRRQKLLQLREDLLKRAQNRFSTHVKLHYNSERRGKKNIGATFNVSLVPKFPITLTSEKIGKFSKVVEEHHIQARQAIFPKGEHQSQPEGFYFLDPRITEFAYLELNMQGLIYYQQEIRNVESMNSQNGKEQPYDFREIFSWVIYYLKYSERIYEELGFNGTLFMQIIIEGVSGKIFQLPSSSSYNREEMSRLDDVIQIETQFSIAQLHIDKWTLLRELFRELCFSCGYSRAYQVNDDVIDKWIKASIDFLMWNEL